MLHNLFAIRLDLFLIVILGISFLEAAVARVGWEAYHARWNRPNLFIFLRYMLYMN
jgi:hypothetical protein